MEVVRSHAPTTNLRHATVRLEIGWQGHGEKPCQLGVGLGDETRIKFLFADAILHIKVSRLPEGQSSYVIAAYFGGCCLSPPPQATKSCHRSPTNFTGGGPLPLEYASNNEWPTVDYQPCSCYDAEGREKISLLEELGKQKGKHVVLFLLSAWALRCKADHF